MLDAISDAKERPLTDKERVQERFPRAFHYVRGGRRGHRICAGVLGYWFSGWHPTEAAAWEDAARRLER
jgi:hypothetical protein